MADWLTKIKKQNTNLVSFFNEKLNNLRQKKPLFSRRKSNSLLKRFQFLLITWGVFVYAFAVLGFWFASNYVIESTYTNQVEQWVNRVDELSTPLYVSKDEKEFELIQQFAQNIPELSYLRLYDADGRKLISEFVNGTFDRSSIPVFEKSSFIGLSENQLKQGQLVFDNAGSNDELMRVLRPVTVVSMPADDILNLDIDNAEQEKLQVIGYIDMAIDLSVYQTKLASTIFVGSIIISFTFLLATFVGRHLIKRALEPLSNLREPLVKLAQGDTNVWVEQGHEDGDEEIVAISNALNSTISAIKGRDAELRRLADYDALTGLINKRRFNYLLEQEVDRVVTDKDSSALLFIDLDQFKYVNDTLGHAAGDRLLVQIANMLEERMRSHDVVSRLGGDEFTILARSVDKFGAVDIASSIVKAMHDFVFVEEGKSFNIYCSIGITVFQSDRRSAEELFSNADMACYQAKSEGRNRYNMYEEEAKPDQRHDIGWSHRITDAMVNDKFELHYQPIVGVTDSDYARYEVLIRMRDDDQGLVSPAMFIPVSERLGLATEIDYWVIRKSMAMLEENNEQDNYLQIYINLSGQIFSDPEFVPNVIDCLDAHDIEASQIVFELTERAAVGNVEGACQKMHLLKEYGFKFAIDDFGSGYSSFVYLKNMPVDLVKIEGEFVQKITKDDVDKAMVKSMVDIAKACGKEVVAEFVCDQPTLEMLTAFGVDYVQGYFIAEPKPEPVKTTLDILLPENVAILKPNNKRG